MPFRPRRAILPRIMLDERVLASVASLDDPLGVLSLYVGLHPEEETGSPPVWELEARHGLEEIERELEAEGDVRRAEALAGRLAELRDEVDLLLSPQEAGLGRALFAGLSGGEAIRVTLRSPFETRVTLGRRARLRPLARALQAGRPAGLILLSDEGLRLFEWRLAEVEGLAVVPFVEPGEERRELSGPAYAHPRGAPYAGPGFRVGQQRDLFERRVEEERELLAAGQVEDIRAQARRRGWEDVVVTGDERLARPLAQGLHEPGSPEVTLDPRLLGWLSPAELAEAAAAVLEEARARRGLVLLARVREEALAGGRGALGLGDTLAALAEGRVEQLILPAVRELHGARAPDGRFVPAGEIPPGVSSSQLRPEYDLAERMVERALETGARLTLLAGEAEAALGSDEAAALLRW